MKTKKTVKEGRSVTITEEDTNTTWADAAIWMTFWIAFATAIIFQ